MMLYKEANIMQVLEGEKAVVHDIFKTISYESNKDDPSGILELLNLFRM